MSIVNLEGPFDIFYVNSADDPQKPPRQLSKEHSDGNQSN